MRIAKVERDLASQAGLWYNKLRNNVVSGDAVNIPDRTHLVRRYVVDTIPQKRCSACHNLFPTTPVFFYRDKKQKDGLVAKCKTCVNAQQQEYLSRPGIQERRHAYQQEYYSHLENKERFRVYRKARHNLYPEVKERERAQKREYHSRPDVKEHLYAQQQEYLSQSEVQERRRAYGKEYSRRPENKEHYRVRNHIRRARKVAVGGTFTKQDVQNMLKGQKGKCALCKQRLVKYEVDHIIPLSRGGSNWPYNLQLLCRSCNRRKHDKLPHEFDGSGQMRLL